MSNLKNLIDLHHNYVNAGKLIEGFEKYYAENVVMQEIGEVPRVGKDTNRTYEKTFIKSIKEIHDGGILSFSEDIDNNKTMVESWMDLTFVNDYRSKMQQVAVQTWENGLIINEIFYHK